MNGREFDEPFGVWLTKRRIGLAMTQNKLAEDVGVDVSRIKAWEAGRSSPRLFNARALAEALGVPPDQRDSFYHFATGSRHPAPPVPSSRVERLRQYVVPPIQNLAHVADLASQQPWTNWPIIMDNPLKGDRYRWSDGGPWSYEDHLGELVRSVVDGWYRMEIRPKSSLGSTLGGMMFHPTQGTFYVAVDVVQPEAYHGNSCGLMFGARNNANFHVFTVRGFNQEYLVTGVRDDFDWSTTPDIIPTYLESIQRDRVNRLDIYATGDQFVFMVNSVVVGTRLIRALPGNAVDVVVVTRQDQPAVGLFANFELREPPS